MSAKEILKQTNAKVAKQGNLQGMKTHEILNFLGQYKPQVSQILPRGGDAERILQVCTNLISRNEHLLKCDAKSLIGAVMQSAELGLNPVQSLGQCYFVPYRGQVQMQIGYKGYIELARRSGQIMSLYAYCVFEGDSFNYTLGLHPDIQHTPSENNSKAADTLTHVYAVAHYKDGGYNFIVLTKDEVEKLRMRSPMQKGAPSGAWGTDYEKMAMAKSVKQLARYMPLTETMQTAILADESIPHLGQFEQGGGTKLEEITYEVDKTQQEEDGQE